MKRQGLFITGLVILSLVLMGSWAAAAEKTGFLDIRQVMLSSDSGKKVIEEFKKTREKLQKEDNDLKKLKEDLDKQRPLLKEDVAKEKATGLVPRLAVLVATPQPGDGVHAAGGAPRREVGHPHRRLRDGETAVAGEDQRRVGRRAMSARCATNMGILVPSSDG